MNFWGTKKETLNKRECSQTYIFTVKDNKVKVEIISIKFEYTSGGYGSGNYYVPETKYKIDINYLYPVSIFKPIQWKENLNILDQTKQKR